MQFLKKQFYLFVRFRTKGEEKQELLFANAKLNNGKV